MKRFIGGTAVLALVVACFASTGASATAPGVCNEQTTFQQSKSPAPYQLGFRGSVRRIDARGSVAATVTGTCSAFLSGRITIRVRNPDGSTLVRNRPYNDRQFRNGYNDTGQPFRFHFGLIYSQPIPAGTCVHVTAHWQQWRYNNNEPVQNGPPQTLRTHGCYH